MCETCEKVKYDRAVGPDVPCVNCKGEWDCTPECPCEIERQAKGKATS